MTIQDETMTTLYGNPCALIFRLGPLVFILSYLLFPSLSSAADIKYFYDNSGRLVRAISEADEATVYAYDEVGNLLSISKQTLSQAPPVITSVSPDVLFIGTTQTVTIMGENLLSTERMSFENDGISVKNFIAADTTITVTLTISSHASLGNSDAVIGTKYGTALAHLGVYMAQLSPERMILFPGGSGFVTVTTTPYLAKFVSLTVKNGNPAVLRTDGSLTLSGGSATLIVNGLSEGAGTIEAGGARAAIHVASAYSGDASIGSRPVSVYVAGDLSGGLISSSSYSVMIEGALNSVVQSSASVSVRTLVNSLVQSSVSVNVGVPGATIVSKQICVKVEKP